MKSLEAKVVVLGAQAVGKTSIVMRCVRDMFNARAGPTIGAAFFTYNLTVRDYRIHLQIWDTAGQERFKSMAPMYYRKASVAILVYDVTDAESFQDVKNWVFELKRNVDRPVGVILFGNKCDLADQRVVSVQMAKDYAESVGADHIEVSAKTNQGIENGFLIIAEMIIRAFEEEESSTAASASSSSRAALDPVKVTDETSRRSCSC